MAVAPTVAVATCVLLGLLIHSFVFNSAAWKAWRRHARLPPGPPAHPLFGHLGVVKPYNPESQFTQWSKELGSDVLYFNMVFQDVVVLNSATAAMELLDKRGATYCDRPRFVLFEEMGWRRTMAFMRWGPTFRLHRRVLQGGLSKSGIVRYRALQERETRVFLDGLTQAPQGWEALLRRFATAVVLGIGFGIDITGLDDKYMAMAEDASYALGHGGPPAGTLVDIFPLLRHLPTWLLKNQPLRFARHWREAVRRLHDVPFDDVCASGHDNVSMMRTLLDQRQKGGEDGGSTQLTDEDLKGIAVAIFAAGQDTTWASLMVFIYCMAQNPDIQARAQAHVDEAIGGGGRLPSFEDRGKLPYVELLVQETLRWCPVSPLGLPHRALDDELYDGVFIPRGALIYANAKAMTHDERIYKHPDRFEPERFLPAGAGGRGEPYPRGQFGFGRRICVGQHLAEASMWIVVASLLATYDIKRAVDPDGREIVPELKLSNGLTSHPEGFACRFVPRPGRAAGPFKV